MLRQQRIDSDLPVSLEMAGWGIGCALPMANNWFIRTANNSNSSGPETCAAVTRTRVKMGMVVVEEENNMVILSFDETCVTIKEEQTSNIMNRIQITLEYSNKYF